MEAKDFLNRVYKGSLGLMLTTMVKQEKFDKEELTAPFAKQTEKLSGKGTK